MIVVPYVTRKAWNVGVSLSEQKSGGAVIKLGVQPTVEGMAGIAGSAKYRGVGRMRRIVRLLVIGQMARHTLR